MAREIFLIQSDGQLVSMREQKYDSEALLQKLITDYPHLLVGDQIDPADPCQWLLITPEASLPSEEGGSGRWAVDHLFLDHNAIPTIVEVKRRSDTRIRREVVGQMLDYAANAVVYWPIEALQAQFAAQSQARGVDADAALAGFLGPTRDPATFWLQAKTNLQAGRVRLLFVADEIPVELLRIVEFLNQQMDPAEVLAIEIKQFSGPGVTTLVPTVLGQSAEAQQRKGMLDAAPRQWNEESFFQALRETRPAVECEAARKIFDWARPPHTSRIWWGKGRQSGSFVPVVHGAASDHQLFAVYTYGTVELQFQWYKAPFDSKAKRLELLERFNAIPGIAIPTDAVTRRPGISLSLLVETERLSAFLSVFDWFLQEVTAQPVRGDG